MTWSGRRTTLEDADRRFTKSSRRSPRRNSEFLLGELTADAATRAYIIGNLRASPRGPATTELRPQERDHASDWLEQQPPDRAILYYIRHAPLADRTLVPVGYPTL
jgi:hypothetical protein